MDLIKKILKGQMLLFSHYTRLKPGTDERKNKQKTEQCFITKSRAEWF